MKRTFVVDDDVVSSGIPFRKTQRGRYAFKLGDHGIIWVSKRLARLSGPSMVITEGSPYRSDNGSVVINSHINPANSDFALVLLRITAQPARRQVTYDLPEEQVIMRCPVVRQHGSFTHRWHELLAWMEPEQQTTVTIKSQFRDITIAPLIIRYDGDNVYCNQIGVPLGAQEQGSQVHG
jgi:hypothetical protein